MPYCIILDYIYLRDVCLFKKKKKLGPLLLVMATFFFLLSIFRCIQGGILPSVTLFCLARSILLTNYTCNSQGRKLESNPTMLGLLFNHFSVVTVDNGNGTLTLLK